MLNIHFRLYCQLDFLFFIALMWYVLRLGENYAQIRTENISTNPFKHTLAGEQYRFYM